MAANNLKALQQALNSSARPERAPRSATKKAKPEQEAQIVAAADPIKETPTGGYMAPSREGKTNITAYLSPDYKSSLRLIQARTGKSLQTLIAESLNDLFSKYDVPTVRHD
ncbi:MAG: hypothetical protein PHE96_01125 [Methylococcales bacterium]|nr:hypothetical protein [Methylococcales bacterium]